MSDIQGQINYLIHKANLLSQTYEEQTKGLLVLGDYITEDIANEWMAQDLFLLHDLLQKCLIRQKAIDLYREINDNFANVSYGGKIFDDKIWSLDGLKTHTFWKNQRELAKQLLIELQLIKI